MADEVIVSGYCRAVDGNRILCCEAEADGIDTDCMYPGCEFAGVCILVKAALEKIKE